MYIFANLIKMNIMTHLQNITFNFGGPTISKSNSSCLRNSEQNKGFPGSSAGYESTCNAGNTGDTEDFDPWVRRSPGGDHGNPIQYSQLANAMKEESGGLQFPG
ncbi:unnamed protein product [Rangifer tarandus platyrhynchus]|uniref:Uncharacterized protein n=2 Tax=Rangifer tarandus platyrhynchus TaxID=3082113 RepID=A0AC59Z954_RANTA|nr:unnamed protein product [Rangifer tarandus platyrhynchus]